MEGCLAFDAMSKLVSVPAAFLCILAILLDVSSGNQIDPKNVTCVWVPAATSVDSTTASPGASIISTSISTSVSSDANDTVANDTSAVGAVAATLATSTTTTTSTSTITTTVLASANDTDDNSTSGGRRLEEASEHLRQAVPARRHTLLSRNLQASQGYWNCTEVESTPSAGYSTTVAPATQVKTTTLQLSNSTSKTQQNTSKPKDNTTSSNTNTGSSNGSNTTGKSDLSSSNLVNTSSTNGTSRAPGKDGCTDTLFCTGHGTADGSSSSQCSCVCDQNWAGDRCSIFIDDAPSTASAEEYQGGFKTTTVLICGGVGVAIVGIIGIVWLKVGRKEKMLVTPEGGGEGDAVEKKSKCACLKKFKKKGSNTAVVPEGKSDEAKKELNERAKAYLAPGDAANAKEGEDKGDLKAAGEGSDAPNTGGAEGSKAEEKPAEESKAEEKPAEKPKDEEKPVEELS